MSEGCWTPGGGQGQEEQQGWAGERTEAQPAATVPGYLEESISQAPDQPRGGGRKADLSLEQDTASPTAPLRATHTWGPVPRESSLG